MNGVILYLNVKLKVVWYYRGNVIVMLNLKYVIDNGLNWLNYVNVMLVGDLNEILF